MTCSRLKKISIALILFWFPTRYVCSILRIFGCPIHSDSKIGFSWIWCDHFAIQRAVVIGHLNLIAVPRMYLQTSASIGHLNWVVGPFRLMLGHRAAIGNKNQITRGPHGVTTGFSILKLGQVAKITTQHKVDCTQSVKLGDFTTIAGQGSQLWTHGYIHEMEGINRYRIDGRILIDKNVYVGSSCIISMGVKIGRGVIIGSGATVAKSIIEPGLYVSAPLRRLDRPLSPMTRNDLQQLTDVSLCEPVYIKKPT